MELLIRKLITVEARFIICEMLCQDFAPAYHIDFKPHWTVSCVSEECHLYVPAWCILSVRGMALCGAIAPFQVLVGFSKIMI